MDTVQGLRGWEKRTLDHAIEEHLGVTVVMREPGATAHADMSACHQNQPRLSFSGTLKAVAVTVKASAGVVSVLRYVETARNACHAQASPKPSGAAVPSPDA